MPGMNPELSQGSHFFHNLIGCGVYYLSVKYHSKYKIRWNLLDGENVEKKMQFVRHLKLEQPLLIKVDGRRKKGIILMGKAES